MWHYRFAQRLNIDSIALKMLNPLSAPSVCVSYSTAP
jgi:hypothetical protein